MALMPAGTMRFAKIGSNILRSDIDGNQKIYNTLLPENSASEFALRKNIANTLNSADPKVTPISSEDLRRLILE